MNYSKTFRSSGKLMICGEYFALFGGLVLALPTQKGQIMSINFEHSDEHIITWKNILPNNEIWFECIINKNEFTITSTSDKDIAERLKIFLRNAKILNPHFLKEKGKYYIENKLEFYPQEGLGSSSTFTNNLAQWSEVNPFELHFKSFAGSGFDVAVAQQNHAILYQLKNQIPTIQKINWQPSFSDEIYFIYLNKKQISRENIKNIPEKANVSTLKKINELVLKMSVVNNISEFKNTITLLESLTYNFIKTPTVKESLFSDYKDVIKSLGAWGGDYIMVLGKNNLSYFVDKGYDKIVPFSEMVL